MRVFLISVVLIGISSTAYADLTGYFKSFGTFFTGKRGSNEAVFRNRLRLKLVKPLSNSLDFEAAWDIASGINGYSAVPANFRVGLNGSRLQYISGKESGSGDITHNPDRFFFTLRAGFADIVVGRQAIAWGSAKFINPTDSLTPFLFNELDQEERPGVDALRVRFTIGQMDELDIGFVGGKDLKWDESSFFIRSKHYLFNTDISFLFQIVKKHYVFGMDCSRNLGRAGVWFETAYVSGKTKHGIKGDKFFKLSTGIDYNLWGTLYTYAEYHYNGGDPYSLSYRETGGYLKGKHYCNLGFKHDIHPLIPANVKIIYNFSDKSLILAPDIEYNIAENLYISCGAFIGTGSRNSEFGEFSDMVYTSLRVYF